MVRTHAQVHPLSAEPRLPNGKNTRSSAPCIHACQLVRTPAQVRPLSAAYACQMVRTHAQVHPALYPRLVRTPPAHYACQMVRTPASAPAQRCIHACQMVRTPAQVRPLSTVFCALSSYGHMDVFCLQVPVLRSTVLGDIYIYIM